MQQFLASLTLQNGLVMHGLFSAIQPNDLPPSGVVAGGYTSPSLILDQFGRVLSASNATSPPVALTNFPNVFTSAPQAIQIDADNHAGLVIAAFSPTATSPLFSAVTSALKQIIAISPVTDPFSGSVPGSIIGPNEGGIQTNIDLSKGGSAGGEFQVNFRQGGTPQGYYLTGLYSIFGTLDNFFQIGSGAAGYTVLESIGIAGANLGFFIGTALTAPLVFYIGRGNYASATSAEVARFDPNNFSFILRGNDASNIVQSVASFAQTFADPTDATYRGQLDIGVWDAGGGTPALRPGLRMVSDGSEAIITVPGPVFQNTPGRARVTAPVTNATAVMANLSDLTLTLIAGRKYTGRMVIFGKDSTAAEGLQFDFNGGTATMTSVAFGITAQGATIGTAVSTALGTAVTLTSTGIATDIQITIDFGCVVNAGGTLIPRFAQNTHAAGTGTVETNSYLWLEDSPN